MCPDITCDFVSVPNTDDSFAIRLKVTFIITHSQQKYPCDARAEIPQDTNTKHVPDYSTISYLTVCYSMGAYFWEEAEASTRPAITPWMACAGACLPRGSAKATPYISGLEQGVWGHILHPPF